MKRHGRPFLRSVPDQEQEADYYKMGGEEPTAHAVRDPAFQAFQVLRVSFALLAIVAGIDKYMHLLTNWDQYVSPILMNALGVRGTHLFMSVDGVIEIIVGIGVFI